MIQSQSYSEISCRGIDLRLNAYSGPEAASQIARMADGSYEPETLDWIDEHIKENDIVWDIGANIGLFSLYAAKKGANVFAFEPSAVNYAQLVQNIRLNDMSHSITPLSIALSDKTGIETFFSRSSYDAGHANSSIRSAEDANGDQFTSCFSYSVPCFKPDDICNILDMPAPAHIKIDVDGFEPNIIQGAEKILKNSVSVMMETQNNQKFEAIPVAMRAQGFDKGQTFRTSGAENILYVKETFSYGK